MKTQSTIVLSLYLGFCGCGDSKPAKKRIAVVPHIGDVRELDNCMKSTGSCGSTPNSLARFQQRFNVGDFPEPHAGENYTFLYTLGSEDTANSQSQEEPPPSPTKNLFGERKRNGQRSTASDPPTPDTSEGTVFEGGFYRSYLDGGTVSNGETGSGQIGETDEPDIKSRLQAIVNSKSHEDYFVKNGIHYLRISQTQYSTNLDPKSLKMRRTASTQSWWYGISFDVPLFANPVVVQQIGNGLDYKITE